MMFQAHHLFPSEIITKIVVKVNDLDLAGFKQGDRLIRPIHAFPATGRLPSVVQKIARNRSN